MFLFAIRQFQYNLTRTMLTSIALGSVFAVIFILQGFEQGQYYQLEQMVLNRKADLIATQAGVANFIAVRSSIPQITRGDVEAVNGVLNAHPITAISIIYEQNDLRTPVYVLVYDTKGGPSSIIEGQGITHANDIVIDATLAKRYNLVIGDTFLVSDFEFKISGITNEAAFFMPFAFIGYDGMIDLFIESEIAPDLSTFPLLSYMLIELEPAANKNSVMQLLEDQVPDIDVFTSKQLSARDVNLGHIFLGPIMGLLITVANVIGFLVVCLIMYADVRARLHSFSVIKALGFSIYKLTTLILFQVTLLLLIALPIGILFAQGLVYVIHTFSPLYLVRIFEPGIFIQTLVTALGFAVFGSLIPLNSIRRSDPVDAFQGDE